MDNRAVLSLRMDRVAEEMVHTELVDVEGIGPVPRHLADGLYRWAVWGMCGGFLTAVLANNLSEAMGRADGISTHFLKEVVMVVYNRLPRGCWGTPERVREWSGWLSEEEGQPLPRELHKLRRDLGHEDPVKK